MQDCVQNASSMHPNQRYREKRRWPQPAGNFWQKRPLEQFPSGTKTLHTDSIRANIPFDKLLNEKFNSLDSFILFKLISLLNWQNFWIHAEKWQADNSIQRISRHFVWNVFQTLHTDDVLFTRILWNMIHTSHTFNIQYLIYMVMSGLFLRGFEFFVLVTWFSNAVL